LVYPPLADDIIIKGFEQKFNSEKKKSSTFLKKCVANHQGVWYSNDRFKKIELLNKLKGG
jgi:hypothetical protein